MQRVTKGFLGEERNIIRQQRHNIGWEVNVKRDEVLSNGPGLKDKINLESRKIMLPRDFLQNC